MGLGAHTCLWCSNWSEHGRVSRCVTKRVASGEGGDGSRDEGTWKLGHPCVCVSKDKYETTEGSGDQRDQGSPSQWLERWLSLGLTTAACVCEHV